jgi:hypothetical protein
MNVLTNTNANLYYDVLFLKFRNKNYCLTFIKNIIKTNAKIFRVYKT